MSNKNVRSILNAVGSGFVGFIAHPFVLVYHTTESFRAETMDNTKPWWLRVMFGVAAFLIGTGVMLAGGIGAGWIMMPMSGYYAARHGYHNGFIQGCKASFSHDFDRFVGRIAHRVLDFFSATKKPAETTRPPAKESDAKATIFQPPSKANKTLPLEQKSNQAVPDFRGQATLPPGQSFLYPPGSKELPSRPSPGVLPPSLPVRLTN